MIDTSRRPLLLLLCRFNSHRLVTYFLCVVNIKRTLLFAMVVRGFGVTLFAQVIVEWMANGGGADVEQSTRDGEMR